MGGILAVDGGAYIPDGLVMLVPTALFLRAALDLCACGSCVMATPYSICTKTCENFLAQGDR